MTVSDPVATHDPPDTARSYIRIRPTAESPTPDTVETHFRRLHRLDTESAPDGILARLRNAASPPTVEWLLVADGRDDATLDYYVGCDDDTALDALERTLRGLFPDTYEFERTDWHPDHLGHTTTTADPPVTAVELVGVAARRDDWQIGLTPFADFHADEDTPIPLAALVEILTASPVPVVYQALYRPKPDWAAQADDRAYRLERNVDTPIQKLTTAARDPDEIATDPAHERRIEALDGRQPRRSFDVNARVAFLDDAPDAPDAPDDTGADVETTTLANECASAFGHVGRRDYEIEGRVRTGTDGRRVFDDVRERTFHPPTYDRARTKLPWTANASRGIVADAAELPAFCVLAGDGLTAAGARAVARTPGERTTLPRPPLDQLDTYRGDGLALGRPLTQDGTAVDDPLVLPPALQPLHQVLLGQTGAGKSIVGVNAILDNNAATAGADVVVEPKGGGMADDLLRAYFARHGHLDDVYYFDCSEVLPAISFFDIRDDLAAGVPRTTATEDRVGHYIDLLVQVMDYDRFYSAKRSPDVIKYLVKALFDPVHGQAAFSHRALHQTARRMAERQSAPAVSDTDLENALAGVVANRSPTFSDIMGGVLGRMEEVTTDDRLARMFNHVPTDAADADPHFDVPTDAADADPHFDLADVLDDDVLVVIDTGEIRSEAQRALTLVVLSNLWTALRRRHHRRDEADADHPLVNLYLEEAASVASTDLLGELLAQAREFDCSVTLSMQFPGQVGAGDAGAAAAYEVLNNVATYVTGTVPHDPRLAQRLATDDMGPQAVANRLRALERGQWLVKLPAPFDEPAPRPFLVESLPLPPGHPEGPRPLDETETVRFEAARALMEERTLEQWGLTVEPPSTTEPDADGETADEDAATDASDDETLVERVGSALPHTKRLPPTVEYDGTMHALRCTECDTRYDPAVEGLERAITCCSSLDAVDRDDVPVCDLNLKLTPAERADSDWSDRQLMFLQAVYNAQQLRYDALEYDLLYDSMLRLQEYVGIDSDAVQDLIDAELLSHDTDHPHRLYSVTPDGRNVIGESYRQGVDYGHGKGDLEESSLHVFGVEVGRRYLVQEYQAHPGSDVTEVVPYYELDEHRRLDIAGLDDDGEVVVAVEVERVNHDVRTAVPEDFDKMAACDPEEAIWIVMSIEAAHRVLAALNDPPDDEPRVEKTYSQSVPPQKFTIDTPGLTAMYTVAWIRDRLGDGGS